MLLVSIRPRFVDAILAGEKRVELRRRQPRRDVTHAVIYATSPRMEVVATFRIAEVLRLPLANLWREIGQHAGVERHEYDAYFSGLSDGVALRIADLTVFPTPVPLSRLRDLWPNFTPPQSYRYIGLEDARRLDHAGWSRLGDASLHVRASRSSDCISSCPRLSERAA